MKSKDTWNKSDKHKIQKGKRGFVPTGEPHRNKRITLRFTEDQYEAIRSFCKEKGMNQSELFREAVYLYLLAHNANPDRVHHVNENQLNLFKKSKRFPRK